MPTIPTNFSTVENKKWMVWAERITMADDYLGKKYEEYKKRKADWEKRRKYGKQGTRQSGTGKTGASNISQGNNH